MKSNVHKILILYNIKKLKKYINKHMFIKLENTQNYLNNICYKIE